MVLERITLSYYSIYIPSSSPYWIELNFQMWPWWSNKAPNLRVHHVLKAGDSLSLRKLFISSRNRVENSTFANISYSKVHSLVLLWMWILFRRQIFIHTSMDAAKKKNSKGEVWQSYGAGGNDVERGWNIGENLISICWKVWSYLRWL